jgi:murein DD-endopeptidase MepM/ murein hydrolase activator NlpD
LLEYNGEWASLYGHLNKILVREGQILRMGDPLGEMGATGHATGVHLHFELIHHRLPVDPLRWLAKSNSYTRR